jgi:hypothetical protein
MWVGVRELLNCSWDPTGVGDFVSIVQGLARSMRRLVWFTFATQCWSLWNIRNKLAIDGNIISSPADAIFKMFIYMQSWRVLVKRTDMDLLDAALDEIRRLYTRTRS